MTGVAGPVLCGSESVLDMIIAPPFIAVVRLSSPPVDGEMLFFELAG
jgi:hypothetical protein